MCEKNLWTLVVLAILGSSACQRYLFLLWYWFKRERQKVRVLPTKLDFWAWDVSKTFEILGFSLHLTMVLSNIWFLKILGLPRFLLWKYIRPSSRCLANDYPLKITKSLTETHCLEFSISVLFTLNHDPENFQREVLSCVDALQLTLTFSQHILCLSRLTYTILLLGLQSLWLPVGVQPMEARARSEWAGRELLLCRLLVDWGCGSSVLCSYRRQSLCCKTLSHMT